MSDLVPVPGIERASRDVIDQLQGAVMAFDEQRALLAEKGDMSALAVGMVRLRELAKAWKILLDAVEADVARLMPSSVVTLEGVGTLQRRKGSAKTTWEHDSLMNRVIADAFEKGEALTPQDLGDVIAKVAGISYWRVGGLQERGIPVDEYRHQEPGRFTVQVHGEGADV